MKYKMSLNRDEWPQHLWHFEQSEVRYDDDPLPGQTPFRYQPGARPVLISAPHGACHWRENYWKQQDGFTAALAHLLARLTNAHTLYTVRRIRPDPNYDDDCDYKRTLARLLRQHAIRLVIDLHGAWAERDFGLALGTIDGRSCPDYEPTVVASLQAQGFSFEAAHPLDRLAYNPPRFKGGVRQWTVTRFVWEKCGVNAAQIELNSLLRAVRRRAGAPPEEAAYAVEPIRQQRAITGLINIIMAI
jgi:hypothetical protein